MVDDSAVAREVLVHLINSSPDMRVVGTAIDGLEAVEAAQRLLARGKSFADISVAELAKEASSSVGAFYSRFRDKDALLHVLQIELNREGSATAAETAITCEARAHAPLPIGVRGRWKSRRWTTTGTPIIRAAR